MSQPIEYDARQSTFTCAARDLSRPIIVRYSQGRPGGLPLDLDYILQMVAADIAEFTYWHATTILPTLNGFQGYDTLQFEFPDASS